MRGQPTDFWGKLDWPKESNLPVGWHPLAYHCADVAACCEALLRQGLTGKRLARLGGLNELTSQQIARLCVLAGLHDLGKFNHGFQAKADPASNVTAGHVRETLALLENGGEWAQKLAIAIEYRRMLLWTNDERTLLSYLWAIISHHGRPQEAKVFQRTFWVPKNGRDPFVGISELREHLERWFPEAWGNNGDSLPAEPLFQHAFFGLVTLADWIASDTLLFPFADACDGDRMEFARGNAREVISALWLDPGPAAKSLKRLAFVDAILPGLKPRPLQQAVLDLKQPAPGSVTVLEAETGAGKTEAALLHFMRLFSADLVDGLYFALPTRTAATQIHQRVTDAVKRIFVNPEDRPPVVMAVPGYLQVDDTQGRKLASFEVLWNDDERERFRFRGWAAEHPKRYLAGTVVVGTIDQVLLSALQVSHSHMRATALLRHLLVVDEVHASDLYMNRLLEVVLDRHTKAGGHAFLMSATLGAEVRSRLICGSSNPVASSLAEATQAPYPLLVQRSTADEHIKLPVAQGGCGKEVAFSLQAIMDSPDVVARLGLDAAKHGARVLILRNTVAACMETQLAVESLATQLGLNPLLFRVGYLAAPHHSRFARNDRAALDMAIESQFGKERGSGGRVAVATQTVQQSLDLDADLLITDLCPMDVLLQRVGRLHRHKRERPAGFKHAAVVVLTPSDRDLSLNIREKTGEARGAYGLGTVYDDLRIIEATWRILVAQPKVRIPDNNRYLVEAAVHSEALEDLVIELGGRWKTHQQHLLGTGIAQKQNAFFNASNWTASFLGTEALFSQSPDERIKTRLGEGDRRIVFDRPFSGPFGESILELTLPHWQAREIDADATPSDLQYTNGRALFSLGGFRFVYDRLGLRAEDDLERNEEK